MDIREWILEYGIAQGFDVNDAVQLIAGYEDEYVPRFGRLGIKASQQTVEADAEERCGCGRKLFITRYCSICDNDE